MLSLDFIADSSLLSSPNFKMQAFRPVKNSVRLHNGYEVLRITGLGIDLLAIPKEPSDSLIHKPRS